MGYDDKNSLDGPDYTCSFCGKKQSQVKKLIAGHNVFICDECIALCNEMLEKDLKAPAEETITDLPKPKEIKPSWTNMSSARKKPRRPWLWLYTTITNGSI